MGEPDTRFEWIFQSPYAEEDEAFVALTEAVARQFSTPLEAARSALGTTVLRAVFRGEGMEPEERGRAFWLELHSRCLDRNLALELAGDFTPPSGWRELESVERGLAAAVVPAARNPSPSAPIARQRPEITGDTLYDVLRRDDPELDRNLDATIAWIEGEDLPIVNLLSYLELPLFRDYAAEHEDEREQNLFLHMLHTWTCYRKFGAPRAVIQPELAEAFTDPRFLRLSSNQFRAPAPALCLQFPAWTTLVRGPRLQWAKEVYLTYCPPPTPSEDPELTLMAVTHDEDGEFGFIPLEVPLSLPGIGESIDAFFQPGLDDAELGGNSDDLRRLTAIVATYCLYATAADRTPYLPQ